jgi:branched-chain amino acid transport system permease protein
MSYALHLLIYFTIYGILAMSLNVMTGYCGLLTMAQASYCAIGAYAYALLTMNLHLDFISAALCGSIIAIFLSLAISLPAWRFKGDSFVLISLAVQQMLFSLFQNWTSPEAQPGTWLNLTNGPFGLPSIAKPEIFSFHFDSIGGSAVLSCLTFLICAGLCRLLLGSPWARLLCAMRDNELAARGLGKNVRLAKVQAVAISCGLAAIAGALYASYVGYIDPTVASLDESVLVLCMVLVGGIGNFRGPLAGAVVLIAIPELLRCVAIPDAIAANIRLLIYGALLILMMHVRPQGLFGSYRLE